MSEAAASTAWWPSEVAEHYGLPRGRDACGQCIGIVAVGGGFDPGDLAAAAAANGHPTPRVVVRRGEAGFGRDQAADEELALDLQVAAATAPGADLAVYFAEPHIADIAPAIEAALGDGDVRAWTIVICWGSSEDTWGAAAIGATEAALAAAQQRRVSVVCASGDLLASGGFAGEAHVFYPAASGLVLACGGTDLVFDADGRPTDEQVWNESLWRRGTGGGISRKIQLPPYQASVALPPSANPGTPSGRGVPDVAALAGPRPGWRIVVGGNERVSGGTSAAAPFWGGMLAVANAARPTPVGQPNRILYARPDLLRPITTGDNRVLDIGYDAGPGWNACCGLGVPRGAALLEALIAAD